MNPVITIKKQTQFLIYKLTSKDKKRLKEVFIKKGLGAAWRDGHRQMCIMQAVAMVTGEASRDIHETYSDNPLCVSPTLRHFMVSLNDSPSISSEQRNSLKKLIPILLNTRPLKVLKSGVIREVPTTTPEYLEAEKERRKILKTSSISSWYASEAEFKKILTAIRKAANLYHTPEEGEDLEVITV